MSPQELSRIGNEQARALVRELKQSKTRETDLRIARRWLKKQRSDGWAAAMEHQARRRARRKTSAAALLKQNAPMTQKDILQGHLEGRDRVTKSWSPLIAPTISHMQQRLEIPFEEVLDWIYSRDPADVFEFCDWARDRAQARSRKAIA